MMIRPLPLFLILPLLLVASCANDDGASTENPGFKPLSQRVDERAGFNADAEGNWTPRVNRRSSFESNRDSPYFQGSVDRKTYTAGEYAKTSWWGKEQLTPESYSGNTDGSRFASRSRLQGQGANEAGGGGFHTPDYGTGNYATDSAREAGGSRLARPGSAHVERRSETFTAPAVIDWRQERALSVGDTKGITGR